MTCFFLDTLNGWAAGDSGVVIHTSDAGLSWIEQNTGIIYAVSDIFFLNKNLGWGISNNYNHPGTIILSTTNGGILWSHTSYPDTLVWLTTIYFLDSLTGYLGGQYGTILKTTNAGVNWAKCKVDTGAYSDRTIYKFAFYNTQKGIACGGNMDGGGVIWRTTNSGQFWLNRYVSPEPIFNLLLVDTLRSIGCGGDFDFGAAAVKTNDNGNSWNYQTLQIFGIGYSIAARTPKEIWVATGYGQYWARSLDTGNIYHPLAIPDSSGIFGVVFADSLHGWAFGNYGAIYKFNTLTIGITPISGQLPYAYNLYQNYPNPFNPVTKITFDIPAGANKSHVKLMVFDITGKELQTLINSEMSPGKYTVSFDGVNYASGIYIYSFETDNFKQSRKMVLLK